MCVFKPMQDWEIDLFEKHIEKGCTGCCYTWPTRSYRSDDVSFTQYEIDFIAMTQKNIATKTT